MENSQQASSIMERLQKISLSARVTASIDDRLSKSYRNSLSYLVSLLFSSGINLAFVVQTQLTPLGECFHELS